MSSPFLEMLWGNFHLGLYIHMSPKVIQKGSSDFTQLQSLLEQVDAEKTAEVIQDGVISSQDVKFVLSDGDGVIHQVDLNKTAFQTPGLLADIHDVLKKHRMLSVFRKEEKVEFQEQIQNFIETGEVPAAFEGYEKFYLTALEQDGLALCYISEDLQNRYPHLIASAVLQNPQAVQYAYESALLQNPDLIASALKVEPSIIEFVPISYQETYPENILIALLQDPHALQYTLNSSFQTQNPEMVKAVVAHLGEDAWGYLSYEFVWDHSDWLHQDWQRLRSQNLDESNLDSALAHVAQDWQQLRNVSHDFQSTHPEVVWAALLKNPEALKYTSANFQLNHDHVIRTLLEDMEHPAGVLSEEYLIQDSYWAYVSLDNDPNYITQIPQSVIEAEDGYFYVTVAYRHPFILKDITVPEQYIEKYWQDFISIDEAKILLFPKLAQTVYENDPDKFIEVFSEVVRQNGMLLQYAPAGFAEKYPKDFYSIVKEAILEDSHCIQFLSEAYQMSHPELMFLAVRRYGPSLSRISPELQKQDPDFYFKALQGLKGQDVLNSTNLFEKYIDLETVLQPQGIENFDDFVAETVITNHATFPKVIDQMLELAKSHGSSISRYEIEKTMWSLVKQRLADRGVFFPPSVDASYRLFSKYFQTQTGYPLRFRSMEVIHEIFFVNKDADNGDNRPVALLLYNKDDDNGAFENYPLIDDLVQSGEFRVFYQEIDHDDLIQTNIIEYGEKYGPLHTVIIAGHGSSQSLRLGDTKDEKFETALQVENEKFFDLQDFSESKPDALDDYFLPEGQVWLYACETGSGGIGTENLGSTLSHLWGRKTYAFLNSNNALRVNVQDDLSLDIELHKYPYHVEVMTSE